MVECFENQAQQLSERVNDFHISDHDTMLNEAVSHFG